MLVAPSRCLVTTIVRSCLPPIRDQCCLCSPPSPSRSKWGSTLAPPTQFKICWVAFLCHSPLPHSRRTPRHFASPAPKPLGNTGGSRAPWTESHRRQVLLLLPVPGHQCVHQEVHDVLLRAGAALLAAKRRGARRPRGGCWAPRRGQAPGAPSNIARHMCIHTYI